ncbi:MAG: hypothetical protein AB7U20_21010 [Planctomycetaceae bacterium]
MKILASTGASASTSLQSNPQAPEPRLANLKVQKTVVESLLEQAPDRAAAWDGMLKMLADAWLREAEFSRQRDFSSSRGPRLQRDPFGNIYYMNWNNEMGGDPCQQARGNQPLPISSGEVLEAAPSEEWLSLLEESIRPKFLAMIGQLYLKVGEEDKAFPYIERIAVAHDELAKDLVHEFIRVWTSIGSTPVWAQATSIRSTTSRRPTRGNRR